MQQVMHRRIFPLLILFFMVSAGPAQAYLLSASQITRQMVKKLGKPVTVSIQQRETFFCTPTTPGAEGELLVFDEMVRLSAPDRFHSVVMAEEKRVEQFSTFDIWFRVVDGVVRDGGERAADRYRDLFQFRSNTMLKQRLAAAGVDLLVTSLNRHAGRIAWVVGAASSDRSVRPQLWVEKESFLPMRWILFEGRENPKKIEIWYHEWFKHGGAFFPRRIEFYADGRLFREIRVESIAPGKPMPAALFNRASYLKEKPASSSLEPLVSEPSEEEARMREVERILSSDPLAF